MSTPTRTSPPELILYHAWASTCSQKVRLALAEKGLAYEGRVINLRTFEHVTPEFLAINPDALVPVLLHQGFAVRESSVINEYLDDVFPMPSLRPQDAQGRARVGMWSRFIDDVPSPAVKKPSFQANLRPYLSQLPAADIDQAVSRMPSTATGERWRQAAQDGIPAAELEQAHADLHRTLVRMDAALAQHAWLAGDSYSLADVNMAPFVARMASFEEYPLARDWPRVNDWFTRLRARPAWAQAQIVEQQPIMTQLPAALAA